MSAYIFSHYDVVVPQASATTMKARCKHCLSVISGGVQTNSNFITHLRVSLSSRILISIILFVCFYRENTNKFSRFKSYHS